MKRIIITVFILINSIFTLSTYCQSADTIKFQNQILQIITDSTSLYYYPNLEYKMNNYPKDITIEDYYYLYYGQIYQKDYKPLKIFVDTKTMNFKTAIQKKRNHKIAFELGKEILKDNPTDLSTLWYMVSLLQKSLKEEINPYRDRLNKLFTAIFSTGNGKSKESAIKIVNMEDDLVIKSILRFEGEEEYLISDNERFYSLWKDGNQCLYFEDIMK